VQNKLKKNIKLKNIINNYEKEKNSMKNTLIKLNQQNKELNNQSKMQKNQILAVDLGANDNDIIMSLQQELK